MITRKTLACGNIMIGSDGSIYPYGSTPTGVTDVAVVVYLGEIGESAYNHGLALCLWDAVYGSGTAKMTWSSGSGVSNTNLYTSSSSFPSESGLGESDALLAAHYSDTNFPAFYYARQNSVKKTAGDSPVQIARPSSTSDWFLPSAYQWNLMKGTNGMSSLADLRDCFSVVGGTNMQSDNYWSSTAESEESAWFFNFSSDSWNNTKVADEGYVRSVLAF